jgi:hypothetical protein
MSQQEFLESPRHYEEASIYEEQGSIEPIREYAAWEQNNEFVNRHLYGEKVQPQPGTRSAAWSLIPLLVLLFLVGGGAFGLTAAFHSTYLAAPSWNDDNFAPSHEWHHPHHLRCTINSDSDSDSDQQMIPDGPGVHLEQGDAPDHTIIVNNNFCVKSDD